MSGLRFFDDAMLDLIERDRRLARIGANAEAYAASCGEIRAASLPYGYRIPTSFHKANEGLCAVRIILAGARP